MMKKIYLITSIVILCGLVAYITLQKKQTIPLKGSILILNQVRGNECCQPGSEAFLLDQVNVLKKHNLPAGFLFRFDALFNKQMIDTIRSYSKATPGVFFEITPQTAKSAGVVYKSTLDQWFRPQNALLLGYSQDDRKKLIDTICRQYKLVFGHDPLIAGSWMIDSWSLQYLYQSYGVRMFEITKEQYGTDSYVLYGGVENQPYIPRKDWAFVPGNESNFLDMVMVRQTISDPLYNYGDVTSSYSSQPNDYMIRKQNIAYFTHLVRQAMTGLPSGFALIGLENSMEKKYQNEFIKQISVVKNISTNSQVQVVNPLSLIQQKQKKFNEISIYRGVDFINGQRKAIWINGTTYRVRIIQDKDKLMITDIRGYPQMLKDPYFELQNIIKSAYWETPHLIDVSKNTKNDTSLYFQKSPVRNDFSMQNEALALPNKQNGELNIEEDNGNYSIFYNTSNKNKVKILFMKNGIQFVFSSTDEKKQTLNKLTSFFNERPNIFTINQDSDLSFVLSPNPQYAEKLSTQIPDLEKTKETIFNPLNYTILYNADKVFLGRNPARIIMRPKQEDGSIKDKSKVSVVSNNDTNFTYTITDVEGHLGASLGMYYVDIVSSNPGFHSYSILVNDKEIKLKDILFAVDCKREKSTCIKNPISLFYYVLVKIGDVWEKR